MRSYRAHSSRAIVPLLAIVAATSVACTGSGEREELPPNPIERRVEPARDRAAAADSTNQARQRAVDELTRQD